MNVIWVTSDTFRRDHLGAYGNQTIRTPSLDALAAQSVRFDRHYASAFPTMPARADHATGRWTISFMGWEPLAQTQVTLAQMLSKSGFHTAAVVDTPFYLRGGMNYDRGFDSFFDVPGQLWFKRDGHDVRELWQHESDRFAPRTFTRAMQWLEKHYKEDFFLYVDVWDPHEPWDAPNYYTELYWPGYDGEVILPVYGHWQDTPGLTEEKVKKAHATYCGEITMVDTWLGYLLRRIENLDLMEKTVIIFTTDHGFYFGEHGGLFGKMSSVKRDNETGWQRSPLYEEVTNIPLLVKVPGIPPGAYAGLSSAIDLAPTVLDVLGQEKPAHVEGQSLLPMMRNASTPGREFVVSSMPFANLDDNVPWVDGQTRRLMTTCSDTTITTGDWTLLFAADAGASELYHLSSDPHQRENVIARYPEIAREIHRQMLEFMRATNVPRRLLEPRSELRL